MNQFLRNDNIINTEIVISMPYIYLAMNAQSKSEENTKLNKGDQTDTKDEEAIKKELTKL